MIGQIGSGDSTCLLTQGAVVVLDHAGVTALMDARLRKASFSCSIKMFMLSPMLYNWIPTCQQSC